MNKNKIIKSRNKTRRNYLVIKIFYISKEVGRMKIDHLQYIVDLYICHIDDKQIE